MIKTMVETFVVPEHTPLISDSEELKKWHDKVAELGLKGQSQLADGTASPVPFEHMNRGMENMFKVLCPRSYKLNDFNKTPIPLEVLGLIELAQKEGHFDKIEIWCDDTQPDPIAVGKRFNNAADRKSGYDWNMDKYLIARWGDEIVPWEQLVDKAKKRWSDARKAMIEKAKSEIALLEATIQSDATIYISGGSVKESVSF